MRARMCVLTIIVCVMYVCMYVCNRSLQLNGLVRCYGTHLGGVGVGPGSVAYSNIMSKQLYKQPNAGGRGGWGLVGGGGVVFNIQ